MSLETDWGPSYPNKKLVTVKLVSPNACNHQIEHTNVVELIGYIMVFMCHFLPVFSPLTRHNGGSPVRSTIANPQ